MRSANNLEACHLPCHVSSNLTTSHPNRAWQTNSSFFSYFSSFLLEKEKEKAPLVGAKGGGPHIRGPSCIRQPRIALGRTPLHKALVPGL